MNELTVHEDGDLVDENRGAGAQEMAPVSGFDTDQFFYDVWPDNGYVAVAVGHPSQLQWFSDRAEAVAYIKQHADQNVWITHASFRENEQVYL